MKNKQNGGAFTLMELMIAMVLVSFIVMVIGTAFIFFKKQIDVYAERQHIYSQVAYALEDMKLRVISASAVYNSDSPGDTAKSLFDPPPDDGTEEVRDQIIFRGQQDVHNITPDDLTDDVEYKYAINPATKDLTLYIGGVPKEVLVEGKYNPKLEFQYKKGYEPNFFVAVITVPVGKANLIEIQKEIVKMEGLRVWFVDVVK